MVRAAIIVPAPRCLRASSPGVPLSRGAVAIHAGAAAGAAPPTSLGASLLCGNRASAGLLPSYIIISDISCCGGASCTVAAVEAAGGNDDDEMGSDNITAQRENINAAHSCAFIACQRLRVRRSICGSARTDEWNQAMIYRRRAAEDAFSASWRAAYGRMRAEA